MKSKAHFRGHPLHPLLVAFPIAFLVGGLLADAAGTLGGWPGLWTTGGTLGLAALVSGLGAAVPGLIDYFAIIPPRSSGKRRATWHMAVNGGALACFATGAAFRDWRTFEPGYVTLALELAGVGLVTYGGWLGGTLVYRNQIAVDHRYAGATKWSEKRVEGQPGEAVAVAAADELKVGQMRLVLWGERRVVVARTEDGYVAFDDRCTHRGGPLSDGVLTCGRAHCPWHGSHFDARTGEVRAGPAEQPISTWRVEQADGQVRLILPPRA